MTKATRDKTPLRAFIRSNKLTACVIAKRCGRNASWISRLMQGKQRRMTVNELLKLRDVLATAVKRDVTLDEIMRWPKRTRVSPMPPMNPPRRRRYE